MWCVSLIFTILPPFALEKRTGLGARQGSAKKIFRTRYLVAGRTTCETTTPSVSSDIREMIPSEITQ